MTLYVNGKDARFIFIHSFLVLKAELSFHAD